MEEKKRGVGYWISVIAGTVVVLITAMYFYNGYASKKWMSLPSPDGRMVGVGLGNAFVRIKGAERPVVVVLSAMGSSSAEWWPLQDILAQDVTVLTYDRAGYGWSSAGKFPRTPEQVAVELDEILNTLNLAPPYILVGHSIGGLYARQYAMMAPGKVAACVFLDPMPVENKRFEQELGPELYRQSGADKTGAMSTGKFFASTGLGRVLAPLIQSAPMFAGYKKLGKNVYPVIYENMVREESYPAMLSEYVSAMDDTQLGLVREKSRFPDIPVVVVYHSPERVVDETVRWAKLTKEDAQKVETLREKLTREYLESGKNKNKPEWVVMSNSGHYMHLDEPGVIAGIIKKCAGKERK